MNLIVCLLFLLLISCLSVSGRLPDVTPEPLQQGKVSVKSLMESDVTRLPGLCRRLKRRRVTVMCNKEKYCWRGRGQGLGQGQGQKPRSGQVCRCPRGHKCSHYFVHSL